LCLIIPMKLPAADVVRAFQSRPPDNRTFGAVLPIIYVKD